MSDNASVKSLLYAFLANLSIAVMKTIAAIFTGSGAMLAEAIHSFADTSNQVLLFFGMREAKRKPDKDHPLGYGKSIYFWAFIVALLLFSVGGVFSIWEGWHKLDAKKSMENPYLAIIILSVSILIEGLSLYGALKASKPMRGNKNLFRWMRDTRKSALMVVVAEDLAAVIGLSLALVAIFLAIYTGNPMFDALGSIAIGVVLVSVAIFVSFEIHSFMIGESVDPRQEERIRRYLMQQEEIEKIFNLIAVQLGNQFMLAVKVKMQEKHNVKALIEQINRIEKLLHREFPDIQWIFFEPDIRD